LSPLRGRAQRATTFRAPHTARVANHAHPRILLPLEVSNSPRGRPFVAAPPTMLSERLGGSPAAGGRPPVGEWRHSVARLWHAA